MSHQFGKAVKIGYIVWSLVTSVGLVGVRSFGNPFSDSVSYRIEYAGKAGETLWANYTITPQNKSHITTTERVIGKLPQTVKFTTTKNSIVSANGSISTQAPITIRIYKNGVECSNSEGIDRAGVSDTIVCR